MSGLIGKKLGMTSVFDDAGNNQICTVIELGPNVVTQIRTLETDGYSAVQLGFGTKKAKRTTKALQGHFEKAGLDDYPRRVVEFRDHSGAGEYGLGDAVTVDAIFEEGDTVNVVGTSKGKGFQGVVKRHGFSGVNDQTHGQHNRQRAPGSIGQASDPAKVFKGIKMHGRTGGDRVTVKNLRVIRVMADKNLLLVKGAVPGHKNGIVEIHKVQR